MTWTPATPSISRMRWISSMHRRLPSSLWSAAPSSRATTAAGTWTPGAGARIQPAPRPGGALLAHARRPVVLRRRERVDGGADEHLRRHRDPAPGQEAAVVAHHPDGFQQRHAVEVEHRLCARLIADLHAVAGGAQDVGPAPGGGGGAGAPD